MIDIYNLAFRSKSGEYAWKPQDVPAVTKVFKKENLAILGGEVWIITKEGKINELYWFDFNIQQKNEDESWAKFVETTSQEFLSSFEIIKDNKRVIEEKEADQGDLYFNISFISEIGYNDLFKEMID